MFDWMSPRRRGDASKRRGDIVPIVNMKGGVGKSTTTVVLAETLAAHHGLSVLVVDLDPQTNATIALIGQDAWIAARDRGRTVRDAFAPFAAGVGAFHPLEASLAEPASDVAEAHGIAVLPGCPELAFFERELLAAWIGRSASLSEIRGLVAGRFDDLFSQARSRFDLILIDCPPGLSVFAEAAIEISDAVIAPTIPDYMSRLGLLMFRPRARRWMRQDSGADRFFVLASKVDRTSTLHKAECDDLRADASLQVLQAALYQDDAIARAARWSPSPRAFADKYASAAESIRALGDEVAERVLRAAPASVATRA